MLFSERSPRPTRPPPQASPLLSSEDGLIFETAPSDPGEPIDGELLAEATLDYEREQSKFLDSTQAANQRIDSRQEFRQLNDTEARNTLGEIFGQQLGLLSADPSDLLLGAGSLISFRGERTALIDPDGPAESALVTSTLPLKTGAGEPVDASLRTQGGSFVAKEPLTGIAIPADPSDLIELPDGIGVSLGASPNAADGAPMSFDDDARREVVTYANTAPDTDSGVISKLTGIEAFAQLRSPASPEETTYELTLPTGSELFESGEGGAFVLGKDGELQMSILAPHSVDAQGADVPTTMRVEGDALILSHPHRTAGFAYPILVDPEFVVESRNWWAGGIGAGTPGWASNSSGSSNYYISNDCPSALSSIDPCGGANAGQGLFAGAKPNTSYPAGSKAWWTWTAPGGSDTYISQVHLNSWKYRKGATSSTSPYAFYTLTPGGGAMNVYSTDGGGSDQLSGTSDTRYFNAGLYSNVASSVGSGANNWRYARLAAFTAELKDQNSPTLNPLNTSAVPTGWMAANQGFAVTASASDQGLGIRGFKSYSPWPSDQTGSDAGSFGCSGSYASPCQTTVGQTSLFFNSNQLPNGVTSLALTAVDALDKESDPRILTVKVDKSAPVVSISGTATQTTEVGTDLQVTATDGSSSDRRSGIESIKVFIEQEAPLPDLDVYSEALECVEAQSSCPQTVTREILLPAQAVAQGSGIKVVVEDQAGNTGVEAASGHVPEWEIEPVAEEIVIDTTSPDAGGDGGATTSASCNSERRPHARFVPIFRGQRRVAVGTKCRDTIDMAHPRFRKAKVIYGFGNDDTIIATNGDQTIYGGGGNDRIFGGMNNDTIKGGAGEDRLFGGVGDDDLFGYGDDDRLLGGPGADTHRGGPGSDFLRGGQGTDKFSGGAGTGDIDTVSFADGVPPGFNDQRVPKTGDDPPLPIVPDGMPDIDTEERGVYVNLQRAVPIADNGPARLGGALDFLCITDEFGVCEGSGSIERFVGTAFSDYFIGSTASETILGGAGGDSIAGGGGADKLYGGPGGDSLLGSGTSFMDGGLDSTGESNSCVGRKSDPSQTENCSRSDEAVIPRTRAALGVTVGAVQPTGSSYGGALEEVNIYIDGSSGRDNIQARYDSADNGKVIVTRTGPTGVWTGGGRFTAAGAGVGCNLTDPGLNPGLYRRAVCPLNNKPVGSVVLSGGPGKDNLSIAGFRRSDEVYLLGGLDQDKLSGGRFNDVLVDGDRQAASGSPGREELEGGGGDDVLIANKGKDHVLGQKGQDLLMSTSLCDGDTFDGGPGDGDNSQWAQLPRPPEDEIVPIEDWGVENSSTVGVHIDLVDETAGRRVKGVFHSTPGCPAGQETSKVLRVERVEASGNPDKVVGDPNDNRLLGRSGQDLLMSGSGNDTINAADGRRPWHMDPTIDCGPGGSASWRNGPPGSGLSEKPPDDAKCTYLSRPLRYGKPPPPPYTQVGEVGPNQLDQMAYMGEVDDSEDPVDPAGTLDSSWEDEGEIPSALYSLNESSGTEALDFMNSSDSGTYTPDPSGQGPELGLDGPMIAAPEEEAVGLDGANDKLELTESFDPADSADTGYSIELWTQIDPAQPLGGTPLFSRGDSYDGVEILIDTESEIVFESNRNGASRSVSTFGFAPDSEYHHVVATIQADEMALFVDGLESAVEFDSSAAPGQTPSAENLVGSDGAGTFTEMDVDTVAIYESALDLADVLENYALGSQEPPHFIPLQPVDTTDTDADSWPDEQDNCPAVSNEGQDDADEDGTGDACDTDTDADGDTIKDSLDNCPDVVNEDQSDADSDGVGDMCTEATLLPDE